MKRIFLTLAGLCALGLSAPTFAQTPKTPSIATQGVPSAVKDLLGRASDAALDKLAKPGSYATDAAIRIPLPGGKAVRDAVRLAERTGLMKGFETQLNDAATAAAGAAKPILRTAINNMTLTDAVSMARGSTGATDYLKKSASDQVRAQIEPLVKDALQKSGALSQISRLSAFGVSETSLVQHVAQKATDGVFLYMGKEETALRKNPLAVLGR